MDPSLPTENRWACWISVETYGKEWSRVQHQQSLEVLRFVGTNIADFVVPHIVDVEWNLMRTDSIFTTAREHDTGMWKYKFTYDNLGSHYNNFFITIQPIGLRTHVLHIPAG